MAQIRLDPDFIYAVCMTWSKPSIAKKSPVLKEEMIITYIDPRESKDDILLSDHSQKAFGWFKLNRSLKPDLIEACKEEKTRARKCYFDYNELAVKLNKPNLRKDFENPDKIVPPVPGTLISTTDFKPSKDHTWP